MKWIHVFMAIALVTANSAHAEITLCKESTVIHEPRADVTHGSPTVTIPDPVLIPITVDMVERYDLDIASGVQAETFIGMMEIYKDGRILYDGRNISGDIKDVCKNGTTEFEDIIEQTSENSDNTN